MQDNYIIELRNGVTVWVTDQQAKVVDQAWADKAPVKIGDSRINTVDIVGIWDKETWYEKHPDQKPRTESKPLPSPLSAVERSKPSVWRDCVMKNRDLLKQGLLPKYTVVEGEIIEKEYYWR